jgi:predicted AAA+ superfamily ATPase
MEINRDLLATIRSQLPIDSRIILIYGARQVGKTTLAKAIFASGDGKALYLDGEDPKTEDLLSTRDLVRIGSALSGYPFVLIDEAQKIPNIGTTLKLIHDAGVPCKILVTGSSSLSLAGGTREALTGRTWSYTLYPISFSELIRQEGSFEAGKRLEECLVLGSYPALFSMDSRDNKVKHLNELSSAYLYKDILELSGIRNPRKLRDVLRLLAFQIGSEVSYQELGRQTGMSADTVIAYIDLLEKSYVVFRRGAYSRNLRKEISKKDKVYFVDNGVRNALIEDFRDWTKRPDQGALWENFLVSERLKANSYRGYYGSAWFWRTHTGAEIDYLEESDGQLQAFEFKVLEKTARAPASFMEAYPGSTFSTVNARNWMDFVNP